VDGPPQQLLADLGVADDRSVGDDDTTLADGAERQFRLGREADLTDQQHIQRGGERGRDLRGDHDATAGKSQHDRLVRAERGQPMFSTTTAGCLPKLPARPGWTSAIRDFRTYRTCGTPATPGCRRPS